MCSWTCLRLWHTKQNLLQRKEKLSKPYSTPSTLCACLFPMIGVLVMITYLMVDKSDPSDRHWITIKDAEPNWKLPDSYYDHMYQLLVFEHFPTRISHAYDANLSVHQYYDPDYFEQYEGKAIWSCNDYLSSENDKHQHSAILNGTLCYHERETNGLVICKDDNKFNASYSPSMYLDIRYNNNYQNGDRSLVRRVPWDPSQSVTVTLQLWTHFEYKDWFNPTWVNNEIVAKSVEYNPFKTKIPMQNPHLTQYDKLACYGVRIIMDRTVFSVYDGTDLYLYCVTMIGIFGGLYSVILLVSKNCATFGDSMMKKLCRKNYEKDQELSIKQNAETQIQGAKTMSDETA